MQDALKKAAAAGRYGDNKLLHVSDVEIAGLASLVPGGRLPMNPTTGLPEAFFFLPFLSALAPAAGAAGAAAAAAPALAAAAAPLSAAATAAPALATGALGSGIAAGMSAAGGAGLGAAAAPALAAATPALAAAPGGIASGLGAASTALPVAAETAAAALPAAAETAAAALPAAAETAATALPAAEGVVGANIPASVQALPSAGIDPMFSLGGAGNPIPSTGLGNTPILSGPAQIGDLAAGIGPEPFASPMASPASTPAAPIVETSPFSQYGTTAPGPLEAPGVGQTGVYTDAGIAGTGGPLDGIMGSFGNMDLSQLAPLAMMMGSGGGGGGDDEEEVDISGVKYKGGDPKFPGKDYRGGIDNEWRYFPNAQFKNGGLVKGFAEGGIASLMDAPQAQAPAAPSGGGNEKEQAVIEAAAAAIMGQHPDPDTALMEFVRMFGETALQDLAMRVRGTMGQGGGMPAGDGMSDSIPATIEGQQPAALSEGEYVVPADVVSALGNGSTDAGGRQFDAMAEKIRAMRGTGGQQPPAIDPRMAMPV